MNRAKFQEVFSKLNISANVRTNLKNSLVDGVKISLKNKSFNVDITSTDMIDEECLEDFKEDIILSYPGLEEVCVNIKYDFGDITDSEKIDIFKTKIYSELKRKSNSVYHMLHDSETDVKDNTIIFRIKRGNADVLKSKGVDRFISSLTEKRLGTKFNIKFENYEYSSEELESIFNSVEESIKTNSEKKAQQLKESGDSVALVEHSAFTNNKPEKNRGAVKRVKKEAVVPISEPALSITQACANGGNVVIEGRIFAAPELREMRNGDYILKSFITDEKDSVIIKLFCSPETYEESISALFKNGSYVKIKGELSIDQFERGEQVLRVENIYAAAPPKPKTDDAPEKRVELHLHTTMSQMDGITPVDEYIKRAVSWGHKAIAVTDHGCVQAFPDALKTVDSLREKGKDIKVLYGCEGYMVNDMGSIVRNGKNESLDSEYVVFDIETTGLKRETDRIIEIGAVKVINGKITDKFSTFINPDMPIPENITKLTSITDEDVKNAPKTDEAVSSFLSFVGNAVLVAHNAGVDVGFIRKWTVDHDLSLDNTVVDTVELGKMLSPELKNYKLDTLCEKYKVSLEHHHRAVDDAGATAELFEKFLAELKQEGVSHLGELNELASQKIDKRKIRGTYHIIVFAKDQIGLKNLYRLVSDANLKYFYRKPRFPKSELIKYREGLIFGSACEAGDLYTAIYNNEPEEEIKEIAEFYDYFEIQPLANNRYMINNRAKNGKSVKDEQRLIEINKAIVELGEKYNKPVVATCDCHFIDPQDALYRKFVQFGNGFDDVDEQSPLFFRTTEEMLSEFEYLGKEKAYEVVVTNTNKIADMMDDVLPVPRETAAPHMEHADEDFTQITYDKAHEIYGDDLPEIVEKRLKRELDSIIGHGYAVLYMIAQKLVWNSMENGYIVGSRGSVGSSFAATMAGITEVNPLQPHYVCKKCKYSDFDSDIVKEYARDSISGFDLPDKLCPVCGEPLHKDGQAIPFETFLGFDGDKEPDIDLNFSGEYQTRAHKYCETLFGEGYVFKAGTISTLQDKTVFGYVNKYCETKNKFIKTSEKMRIVQGCVGVKRSTGQHPGGLMVVPNDNDILNFTPIQHPADKSDSDVVTTHFDYHSISGRLLKLDMLGHDVPTIIYLFKELTGVDPLTVPLDDRATVSLFTSPEALGLKPEDIGCETGSLGLPEFGTHFVRQMLMDTKPNTFSDLVRISGLSHGTMVWIGNAADLVHNNIVTIKDVIATRDDIMGYLINYGIENFTAFSIMEFVRKGKAGKDKEKMAKYEKLMREHNVPDWYIESCKKIQYLFPKGHAVAYVTNTIRIGYFKINYPLAFYAATFSVKFEDFDYAVMCFGRERVKEKLEQLYALPELTGKDKTTLPVLELVNEMYARGFEFARINLYKSHSTHFGIINEDGKDKLLPPFCTLQSFGQSAAERILVEREKGDFTTIEDFSNRTLLGKKTIEMLKENGIFGNMRDNDQLTLFEMI